MPLVTFGGRGSFKIAFLFAMMPAASSAFSASAPVKLLVARPQIDQHQVIVRPAAIAGDSPSSPAHPPAPWRSSRSAAHTP